MIKRADPVDLQRFHFANRKDLQILQRTTALRLNQSVNDKIVSTIYRHCSRGVTMKDLPAGGSVIFSSVD